jgi:mRNA interferase MazF
VVIERGSVHWADLGEPDGSRPAKRRPVLVIQANPYNASRLATVLVAVLTSNTKLATAPGNVFLPVSATGLPRDSVVNVTALVTLNKDDLSGQVGEVPLTLMRDVDKGLRRVLAL